MDNIKAQDLLIGDRIRFNDETVTVNMKREYNKRVHIKVIFSDGSLTNVLMKKTQAVDLVSERV